MNKILKSIVSVTLLLSAQYSIARRCSTRDNCNVNCNTVTTCNTVTNCNTFCDDRCDDRCERRRDRCSDRCSDRRNDNCSRSNDCDSCQPFRTGIHYRSQGANTARELVGWQWDINKPFMCENYNVGYLAFEYQRSFKPCKIARSLFGSDTLRFEGSLVPNRTPGALVADNFGLSRTFQGSISFCPRIENYIVDLGWFAGLDCWMPGLYFRLHAPIVYTRWKLGSRCNDCCEVCPTTNGAGLPDSPCYVSSIPNNSATGLPVNQTLTASSIEQALSGTFTFGDMKTPWSSGRFNFCNRHKTGLADIDLILGYNWCNDNCYHFGTYLQAVVPTGPNKKDNYVFSPVVGNGGHFELGAGISAHAVLYSCENSNLALFFEGNVTHMFNSRQCRLFDFCKNGFLSRYLLLKQFDLNGTDATYNGNLVSATNFNNRRVDVKIAVKGDASLKLAWRRCGWGLDLGYNVYGTTHEHIRLRADKCTQPNKAYGIKGTTDVCCFNYPIVASTVPGVATSIFPAGTAVDPLTQIPNGSNCQALGSTIVVTPAPNNATQPNVTAFTVDNTGLTSDLSTIIAQGKGTPPCSICLTSSSNAPAATGTALTSLTAANGFFIANNPVDNSNTVANLLSDKNLDIRSAEAPAYLTHKVFVHANYAWESCCWNPELGIGGEAEFKGKTGRRNCRNTGVNQWGVWVKGSVSF